MTTPRQVEANKRNALRSTGPRTITGKARSCLNSVTHGLTAGTVILPGEDPEEFERRVAGWREALAPCNPFEEGLVRQAVGHFWRLDRVESMECAILAEGISTARDDEIQRRREEAADLGRRLLPVPRPEAEGGPHPDRRGGPDDPDDPARLLNRLEATTDGCRWLIDRWAEKRRSPEAGLAWSPAEMVETIRLLGKRPLEDVDDCQAESVILACVALDRQRSDPFAALWEGLSAAEVQRYRERLLDRRIGERMPCSPEHARAMLLEVVDESVAELRALERQHHRREEAHAATQADCLLFDDSDEGESFRRHQTRSTRAALRIVEKFRVARRRGEELTPDPPSPPAHRALRRDSRKAEEPLRDRPAASQPEKPHRGVTLAEEMADLIARSPETPRIPSSLGSRPKDGRAPARMTPKKAPLPLSGLMCILGSLGLTLLLVTAAEMTDGSRPSDRPDAPVSLRSAHPAERDGSAGPGASRPSALDPLAGPAIKGSHPRKGQIEPIFRPVLPVVPPRGDRPERGSRGPPAPPEDLSSAVCPSPEPPISGA